MSNAALLSVIKRMHKTRVEAGDEGWIDPKQERRIVTHGFRSTLRTWAEEETGFSHNVLEKVLNHAVKDDTHAAYQRGDLLKKRRKVMEAWAKYALPSQDNVVALRG
jgi:integrase